MHNLTTQICGEIAGVPLYLPILIGMGFTEMSMNIGLIGRTRRFISKIDKQSAQNLVIEIMKLSSAEEIEKLLLDTYKEAFSDEA
jgi:phosphotransferase system enzyme I (PtsI)